MPRPPILPVPDRKAIFESGRSYDEWLAAADAVEQAERLRARYDEVQLPAACVAALEALSRRVNVIAIAETWCGDVIRHTPVLMRMAAVSEKVAVRFIAREDYLDFFVRFLTNGGEAVPKFVFCSEEFVETGSWGPMSSTPRKWIAQGKACGDVGAARQKVGAFYEADGDRETIAEFTELVEIAGFAGF